MAYEILFNHPSVRVVREGGRVKCYRVINATPKGAELMLLMERDYLTQHEQVLAFAREQVELSAQPLETLSSVLSPPAPINLCECCEKESIDPPAQGDYVIGVCKDNPLNDPESEYEKFAGFICDYHFAEKRWQWWKLGRNGETQIPRAAPVAMAMAVEEVEKQPERRYTYWLSSQKRFPDDENGRDVWRNEEPVPTVEDGLRWGMRHLEEVKVWGVPGNMIGKEIQAMTHNNIVAVYVWWGVNGWRKRWFPKEGDGCSLQVGSDRYAYTVSRVSATGKTMWMKADKAERIDSNGQSESQRWSFEPDPNGRELKVTLRKDGSWQPTEYKGGAYVCYGRSAYRDPSF